MATFSQTQTDSNEGSFEDGGTISLGNALERINETDDYLLVRFDGANIASGSTINSADYTVDVRLANGDDPILNAYVEASGTPAAPGASANDISNRTLTTATTSVNETDVGTGAYVIDITSALQEVADSFTITEIAVILVGNSGCNFIIRMPADSSDQPTLDVDYTEPAAGGGKRSPLQSAVFQGGVR